MGQWQARCKWTGTGGACGVERNAGKNCIHTGRGRRRKKVYASEREGVGRLCVRFHRWKGKIERGVSDGVCPSLVFRYVPPEQKNRAAENLLHLIEKNEYRIGTGFPGTPYILFALADNDRADAAYKMLLNAKCPSWLYEVDAGATTVWERWDALDENGLSKTGDDGTGGWCRSTLRIRRGGRLFLSPHCGN